MNFVSFIHKPKTREQNKFKKRILLQARKTPTVNKLGRICAKTGHIKYSC